MKAKDVLIRLGAPYFSILLLFQCNSAEMPNTNDATVFYRQFDLFRLNGVDTLNKPDKRQSVEVRYRSKIPEYIKYYKAERTVTLVLEDTFRLNNKRLVYVFSTSNFHGGAPGKH